MRIPKHIAIIPDGNRRWAQGHQMKKKDGYQKGLFPGVQVLRKAKEYGISEITYYGFTTDNCKRPKEQKEAFQKACVDALRLIKEGRKCFSSCCWKYRIRKLSRRITRIYNKKRDWKTGNKSKFFSELWMGLGFVRYRERKRSKF